MVKKTKTEAGPRKEIPKDDPALTIPTGPSGYVGTRVYAKYLNEQMAAGKVIWDDDKWAYWVK